MLLHTSGTTSKPKLVPLTSANLAASARHISATLSLSPEDRCLNVMPLFHIHGLLAALLASLSAGASVVCSDGVYATGFYHLAARVPAYVVHRRADHAPGDPVARRRACRT